MKVWYHVHLFQSRSVCNLYSIPLLPLLHLRVDETLPLFLFFLFFPTRMLLFLLSLYSLLLPQIDMTSWYQVESVVFLLRLLLLLLLHYPLPLPLPSRCDAVVVVVSALVIPISVLVVPYNASSILFCPLLPLLLLLLLLPLLENGQSYSLL